MTNFSKDAAAVFLDLLDRFGADLSRWPQTEREQGEQILAASPEARQLLDDAQALWDRDKPVPIKAPDGLKERILRRALSGEADSDPTKTKP